MNRNIYFLESITDIQYPGNDSTYSHNINVDYEGVRICGRTVVPFRFNTLNLRTPIFTVACKKFYASEESPYLLIGSMNEQKYLFHQVGI